MKNGEKRVGRCADDRFEGCVWQYIQLAGGAASSSQRHRSQVQRLASTTSQALPSAAANQCNAPPVPDRVGTNLDERRSLL
jgi:hypothetical protein